MAREKFKTLTEQMYYVLIALQEAKCGVDVMEQVREITKGRIKLGPGTLYALLGDFQKEEMIEEVETEGSKRCYQLTSKGRDRLEEEHQRHLMLIEDYRNFVSRG